MQKTLVVVAHPDPDSLTHHVAGALTSHLSAAGVHTESADLAAEGFDPRYTVADREFYQFKGPIPGDVSAEQERIDRADSLVLVFPVYWWSMPALLKGWVDRVFTNGWAYDQPADGPLVAKLGRLTIHFVLVAGTDAEAHQRHGYDTAMATQLMHGIVDFCGAKQGNFTYVFDSETASPDAIPGTIEQIASGIVDDASARI